MEEDAPRDRSGVEVVAAGLGLIWVGWILSPVATMAIAIVVRNWSRFGDPPASVIHPLVGFHDWALMLGGLACSVGTFLCAAAPRAVAGKIYGALVCHLLPVALQIAERIGVDWSVLGKIAPFAALAGIVGGVLFLLFLHDLAEHLGLSDLAERAAAILSYLMIAVAGYIVAIFVSCIPLVNLLLPPAIGIFLLVTMVRYLGVLADIRRAILNPPPERQARFGEWTMPAAAPPSADRGKTVNPDDLELPP